MLKQMMTKTMVMMMMRSRFKEDDADNVRHHHWQSEDKNPAQNLALPVSVSSAWLSNVG